MKKHRLPSRIAPVRRDGFSLIEIIAVAAVLTIIVLLAVPAIESMLKGSRVTIGANLLVDRLNLARQIAISKNLPVEVRLYKLPEKGAANSTFRAIQLFTSRDGVLIPVENTAFLPQGVIIAGDDTLTSLFLTGGPLADPAPQAPVSEDPKLPGYEHNYEYVSFRIKANGETDMQDKPAYLTLVSAADPRDPNTKLPKNFATIQIDPLNSRTKIYRP